MGRITNTSHPLRIQEDFFRIFIFFYDGHPSPEICCPKEMGAVILPRVIIKTKMADSFVRHFQWSVR
jgi:hypothetical protein